MPEVMTAQRKARRRIIRQWVGLKKEKRDSIEAISVFANAAAKQNRSLFARSRRDPYEKIMGWLLPRAHL
jgi:hypothetical protein